jgi:hypothetical protein
MKRAAWLLALPLAFACGSSSPSGTYTIAFQSTAQAVVADAVHVTVYDASASAETCVDLLVKLDSHQDLPAPVVDLAPTTPCDLSRGEGSLNAPLSTVAVLAVVTKGGATIARGCTRQTLTESAANVTVDVAYTNAAGVAPPATTCASLAQHCSGGC